VQELKVAQRSELV